MVSKTWTIGTLTLLVSAVLITIYFSQNDLKMDISKTNTKFYVYEDKFILAGTETSAVYNGSKALTKISTSINELTQGNTTTIYRNTLYDNNVMMVERYTFDGSLTDRTKFPIEHIVEIKNADGFIYQYTVSNLDYNGGSRNAVSPESFGHSMKVEWQDGAYYQKLSKITSGGKLVVKYKILSDDVKYSVRLFDPPYITSSLNSTTKTYINQDVTHSVKWDTNGTLSNYTFNWCDGAWNGSGCSRTYVYNNVTSLMNTDTGDWVGTTYLWSIDVLNNENVYVGGFSGKFGRYNATSNVLQDLSSILTWSSGFAIYDIYVYDNNNVYLALDNGRFGRYNASSNTSQNLTIIASWLPVTTNTEAVCAVDNNNVFLGFEDGKFGKYNTTSNTTIDLSTSDIDNWMGADDITDITCPDKDNVYISLYGGKFGKYNTTSNTSIDLSTSDVGDWIGVNEIMDIKAIDKDNVYLSGNNGIFGKYNATTNTSVSLGSSVLVSPIFFSLTNLDNKSVFLGGSKMYKYNVTSNISEFITSDYFTQDTDGIDNQNIYGVGSNGKFIRYSYTLTTLWDNSSITAFGGNSTWSNVTKRLRPDVGLVYAWSVSANTTDSITNTTPVYTYTSFPAFYFNISNFTRNINTELNSSIYINTSANDGNICIDIEPVDNDINWNGDYGINYTCSNISNGQNFIIDHFTKTLWGNNSNNITLTYTSTQNISTVYINASHYDLVSDDFSFNSTGNKPVNIYVGNQFISEIPFGEVVFNGSNATTISKNVSWYSTSVLGYLKIHNSTVAISPNISITPAKYTTQLYPFVGGGGLDAATCYNVITSNSSEIQLTYIGGNCKVNSDYVNQYRYLYNYTFSNITFNVVAYNIIGNASLKIKINNTIIDFFNITNSTTIQTFSYFVNTSNLTGTQEFRAELFTTNQNYSLSNTGYLKINNFSSTTYPKNVYAIVGETSYAKNFNFTLEFNTTKYITNFSNNVNTYMLTCTFDASGFCLVPIYFYSDTPGTVTLTNLSYGITTGFNVVYIPKENLQSFLDNNVTADKIPLTFESTSGSVFSVNKPRYYYQGGNYTYKITAHNADYSVNTTYNVTYYFSRFNNNLPYNWTTTMFFQPRNYNSTNVSAYSQNNITPVLNISSLAYSNAFNISVKLNETTTCLTLIRSLNNNISQGTNISTNYTLINNITALSNQNVWLWANLDNCNASVKRYLQPKLQYKTCCLNCDICGET